jgi:hypothetical protein
LLGFPGAPGCTMGTGAAAGCDCWDMPAAALRQNTAAKTDRTKSAMRHYTTSILPRQIAGGIWVRQNRNVPLPSNVETSPSCNAKSFPFPLFRTLIFGLRRVQSRPRADFARAGGQPRRVPPQAGQCAQAGMGAISLKLEGTFLLCPMGHFHFAVTLLGQAGPCARTARGREHNRTKSAMVRATHSRPPLELSRG